MVTPKDEPKQSHWLGMEGDPVLAQPGGWGLLIPSAASKKHFSDVCAGLNRPRRGSCAGAGAREFVYDCTEGAAADALPLD